MKTPGLASPVPLIGAALLFGILLAYVPSALQAAEAMEKSGTTPYVTHFVFRPVQGLEVGGVGTATLLEAVGTTQNTKGEKMLDKMAARCMALNIDRAERNTSTAPARWPTRTAT